LRFRLGGPAIRSTLTLHPDAAGGREGTFALTVVPPTTPADSPARPRDVVFVIDRSGSMEGWKIVAARRALARMIDTLGDADRFCVIAFDTVMETPPSLPAGLSAATDRQRFRAVEYLATLNARGGTMMDGPLDHAVKLLASGSGDGRDRILVLITDGQVGNEDQILQTLGKRLKGIRVFTLGIDRSVNEGFLRRLAEQGGGSCELVESEDRLDDVMTAVHRRIGTPLLTGLSLASDDFSIEPGEVVPRRLPDLFEGSPLLILGRYRGRPAGALTIRAAAEAGRAWSEQVLAEIRDNPAIAAAWARGQVRQLEDRYSSGEGDRKMLEKAIIAVSLKFQVLCRFTAYVAVDRSQVVNEGGTVQRITQPVEQPEGWEASPPLGRIYATLSAPARHVACRAPRSLGGAGGGSVRKADLDPGRNIIFRRAAPPPPSPASPAYCSPEQLPAAGAGPPGDELAVMDFGLCLTTAGSFASPPSVQVPDRFEIREHVAAGALGQVFKVFDKQRGQVVLITIYPSLADRDDALARWRREMEILASLAHPAFIPILEVDRSASGLWIVKPLVEGRTLAERLRSSGRMDPREAAALVAELAEALQVAHRQGLVHGDLMPGNILLAGDGHPRLLELGEGMIRSNGLPPGSRLGSPAHMPPELIQGGGNPRDPRVDVYGLGVVLYEALTNQKPFSGSGVMQVLNQVLNVAPKPPRKLVRSIPAALEAICLKAMARKPDERYATAADLAAALRAFREPARRRGFWK
jgi:hypothetical protein